jgi:hypothetical protein
MPAYNLSGYYCITFILFMILNLYLFNNILLASIYSNYKKHLKAEVKVSTKLRQDKLKKAFDLLKTQSAVYTEKYSISYKTFQQLIERMYPSNSESKTKILFNLLDRDDGNHLCKFLKHSHFFVVYYLSLFFTRSVLRVFIFC